MAESFGVPTKVLIEQGEATRNALRAPANKPGLDALGRVGFDVEHYPGQLTDALQNAKHAEAEQERAKADYTRELKEDRVAAENGYRWILRLQARVRMHMAASPGGAEREDEDLPGRFRFGQLRRARARGVAYELRILLPEAEELQSTLANSGVTPDFLKQGRDLLTLLGVERTETAEAKARQKAMTRDVRKTELILTRALNQLAEADQAAALETVEGQRWFNLDVISAEKGRVEAARQARLASRDPGSDGPDDDAE